MKAPRTFRAGNLFLAAGIFLAAAPAASAHHSFAMFDETKSLTLSGTVKDWQWSNPHSWLTLTVMQDGKAVDYGLESRSIYILKMAGMKRTSIKPGDKVTVTYQPLRSGAPGGSLTSVTAADGTQILRNRPPPPK